MLALTNSAVEAVKTIVSSSDDVSETSDLRMVAEHAGAEMNLQLSVALRPGEDDEVIAERGARVFLEPEACGVHKSRFMPPGCIRGSVRRGDLDV